MSRGKIGIGLIGAWGRVGTAVSVALAGLQSRMFSTSGLVTEQPDFGRLDLADWPRFVLGGHEIRKTSATVEARNLFAGSTIVTAERLTELATTMTGWDRNVRTGALLNSGPEIESRASTATLKTRGERPSAAVRRIAVDLEEFRASAGLEHVIVVNVASVDPPVPNCDGLSCEQLLEALERSALSPVPTSVLYAVAALQLGHSYLNWMRSPGPDVGALDELAREKGALHMGRQGRTDLASIGLLHVAADDERLRLANALLDVVRLCEREHRRGRSGLMTHLSCFFKQPMGQGPDDVAAHRELLYDWVRQVASASPAPADLP